MNHKDQVIFFVGIGGIGMSALARYFLSKGNTVYGYDKTRSELTDALSAEGAMITYEDAWQAFDLINAQSTLVIYTPAIS